MLRLAEGEQLIFDWHITRFCMGAPANPWNTISSATVRALLNLKFIEQDPDPVYALRGIGYRLRSEGRDWIAMARRSSSQIPG